MNIEIKCDNCKKPIDDYIYCRVCYEELERLVTTLCAKLVYVEQIEKRLKELKAEQIDHIDHKGDL